MVKTKKNIMDDDEENLDDEEAQGIIDDSMDEDEDVEREEKINDTTSGEKGFKPESKETQSTKQGIQIVEREIDLSLLNDKLNFIISLLSKK